MVSAPTPAAIETKVIKRPLSRSLVLDNANVSVYPLTGAHNTEESTVGGACPAESPPTSRVTDRAGTGASVGSVSRNGAAPLRIGILGAARIAPSALIKPAKGSVEVVVAAVAARESKPSLHVWPRSRSALTHACIGWSLCITCNPDTGPSSQRRRPSTAKLARRAVGRLPGTPRPSARRPPAEAEAEYYAHLRIGQHTGHT